jgi:predicted amidophosphoribosyltransferase
VLFATRCPTCRAPGPVPCAACADELRPAPVLPPPDGLDACTALFEYEGPARDLVVALKYRGAHRVARRLGRSAAAMQDPATVDVVTWAPATRQGRRHRGYDQGQLLAWAVAGALGRPCRRLLSRATGPAQTGADAAERRIGPRLRLAARSGAMLARYPRVLVVDDVVTTGATLSAAARVLRGAGASEVRGLAVTRTPPPARFKKSARNAET